jgi:hypothetical protein
VDIVVRRCRGRETNEKCVAAEIYVARDARQHDGEAKRTAARWCRGKENAHMRAVAGHGVADFFF